MRPASVLVLAALLAPALAHASEGEKALSVGAAYTAVSVSQDDKARTGQGGVVTLEYEYALGDAYGVRATATGGPLHGPDGWAYGAAASVGLTYRFDVVKYVPYFGAGAGALLLGGSGYERAIRPVLELNVGLDVLRSRTSSWGLDVRLASFVGSTVVFTIGPRFSWRWGYF